MKEQRGFTLIITILGLAVMSTLGVAIIGAAISNYKIMKIEGRSQGAYYIAESGINYMYDRINRIVDEINIELKEDSMETDEEVEEKTSEEFFREIEKRIITNRLPLSNFSENDKEKPKAFITVTHVNTEGDTRDYKIKSEGKIGNNTKTVSSVISLNWVEPTSNPVIDNLLFYTNDFVFQGSNINGKDGTTVSDGIDVHDLNGGSGLKISTMYFNGPVTIDSSSNEIGSKESPGTIYVNGDIRLLGGSGRHIYGDVRVKGDFTLQHVHVHGDIYVDGDVIFGETAKPQIYKNLYYTGDFKPQDYHVSNYPEIIERCKKVPSVGDWEVPVRNIKLKDEEWYTANGYEKKGNVSSTVPDNAKWFVNNYNYTNWPQWDINDQYLSDVVIISKNDITINTATNFSGALIAPNGTVNLPQGGSTFNGVIIAKNGINFTGGGTTYNMKKLQEIFNIEDIPVLFSVSGESNNGENDSAASGSLGLSIIRSIIQE